MSFAGLQTFTGVAHPWMCDVMGHVNVRHFAAMFDDASFHLLGHIAQAVPNDAWGWADVQSTTHYQREIRAGELLVIHASVLRVGKSSLSFRQVLRNSIDGEIRAINETVTVWFDQLQRSSRELTLDMRQRAAVLMERAD